MRKFLSLLWLSVCVSSFSQNKIEVISFKQSLSDISAQTNRRDDTKGVACALIKVQFPMRNVLFDGNIAGEVSFKTNEYWVYMPEKSTSIEVKAAECEPLTIDFNKYGISSVESKGTYELCILQKEKDASQLYNDGMVALAKNDIVNAYDKLQKAANAGYSPASYILGMMSITPYDKLDEDPNSQDSYQEAYNFYKKAAAGGYPKAQYALGALLLEYQEQSEEQSGELAKIKVDQNLLEKSKIWELIRNAADKGVVEAQYLMISDDMWCKENAEKGIAIAEFGMGLRYDKEEISGGYTFMLESIYELGSIELIQSEDYNTAFSWYQRAANHGLDIAQWRLGEMYAFGLGVEPNIESAIAWRTKAAEQGNYIFQFMMGNMYTYGRFADYFTSTYQEFNNSVDVPVDAYKADLWLRKLSYKELNNTQKDRIETNGACSNSIKDLISLFKDKKDYEKVIYWYQREIEDGLDYYCELGEMYFKGWGVAEDFVKARELFEKADEDNFRAKAYLGVIYRDGLGVESELMKAKDYLMTAASNKDAKGMYELALLLEKEGNSEEAKKLFGELKAGWAYNDIDGYYRNKASEAINGELNSTVNNNAVNKQTQPTAVVEKQPTFSEGNPAAWIALHMQYPPIAAENNIQGQVVVGFVIEENGTITNVHVLNGVDPLLDKEAVRVIKSMPKWNPGTQDGKPVRVKYSVPVNFGLSQSSK